MKFTKDWLDIHLKSKKKESQIIDKLNNIGLEVEKIEPIKNEKYSWVTSNRHFSKWSYSGVWLVARAKTISYLIRIILKVIYIWKKSTSRQVHKLNIGL